MQQSSYFVSVQVLSLGFLVCLIISVRSNNVELHKCPDSRNISEEFEIPRNLKAKDFRNTPLVFRFSSESSLKCSTKWITKIFPNAVNKSKILFYPTGSFYLQSDGHYDPEQFCVSKNTQETLEIKICKVSCGITHSCIPKCCPVGKIFNYTNGCVPNGVAGDTFWEPKVHSKNDYKGCGKVSSLPIHYQFHSAKFPQYYTHLCFPYIREKSGGFQFRLLETGILGNMLNGNWDYKKDYCIDGKVLDEEDKLELPSDYDFKDYEATIVCHDQPELEEPNRSRLRFYATCFSISIVFIILTIIVYVLIWEKHNIHGWTVFSFVVSMLVLFIFLLTAHIKSENENDEYIGSVGCQFLAIVSHFAFISTISWLSVINMDLWLTFRSLAPPKGRKMLHRYFMYLGFAISLPFVIVLFGLVMDSVMDDSVVVHGMCGEIITSSVISPRYGKFSCGLHPEAEGVYLYLPIGILITCNIFMFSSTIYNLWRYRQTTRNAVSNSSAGNQKQSLFLFLKLFLVMGITWVFEVIAWAVSDRWTTDDWYKFAPFDLINFAQAIAIFFIFAAKRENLLFIFRKHPMSRGIIGPFLRLRPCRVDNTDIEQTDMTSADRKIDRNTKMLMSRISTTSGMTTLPRTVNS